MYHRGIEYPGSKNKAAVMVMDITAKEFGWDKVPYAWLSAALKVARHQLDGTVAPPAAIPKKKMAFAWGEHKKKAAELVSKSVMCNNAN